MPRLERAKDVGSVLAFSLSSFLVGLATGAYYGGTYAPSLRFSSLTGYEAGAQLGALISAGITLVVSSLAHGFLRPRRAKFACCVCCVVVLAFLPLALFPLVRSRSEWLVAVYLGAGVVGAAGGYLIGRRLQR